MSIFYTSDLHIGHKLVAGIRGFHIEGPTTEYVDYDEGTRSVETVVLADDPEAHAAHVAKIWDATVRPNDVVYVLGDTGMSGWDEVLAWFDARPGTKHLIAGNHDPVHPSRSDAIKLQKRWLETFATINPYATRKLVGQKVMLSHFPYASFGDGDTHGEPGEGRWAEWRIDEKLGKFLLHGHTHGLERDHGRQFHVGWDAWHRLVHQDEIIAWLERERQ